MSKRQKVEILLTILKKTEINFRGEGKSLIDDLNRIGPKTTFWANCSGNQGYAKRIIKLVDAKHPPTPWMLCTNEN